MTKNDTGGKTCSQKSDVTHFKFFCAHFFATQILLLHFPLIGCYNITASNNKKIQQIVCASDMAILSPHKIPRKMFPIYICLLKVRYIVKPLY